ncbi:MAG TPA: glucose-6-phosphate dehydrogenase (coenzyme-F420) [Baekduia sp.]|nr:glucose-6-phosphate dehydrogenase (coenzyme-F420) [Baekduia sp.]
MDPDLTKTLRIGYKASAEQFDPSSLLAFTQLAEELGFDSVAISDHFQPWRHHTGHAPAALPWLGAATSATHRLQIGTSVLTPTLRYHPSVVAQAFATLACLAPGRIFLGVGTGESMNETPATGADWPGAKERRLRLAESITLMRKLWFEERVDFDGDFYRTSRATIYDRPPEPVPVYVAASGPLAAKLVGRVADGFICTSGKKPELYQDLIGNLEQAAADTGRDPQAIDRMIEIKVSYDTDPEAALRACDWWGALALTPEQKTGVEDPLELERLADANVDQAHTRFIVSTDPDEVVERIAPYVELGFRNLVIHGPGTDQARFLRLFAADVLPRLRARCAATAVAV